MPRSRVLFTAPIVLAILIGGMFAIRSRGDDSPDLNVRDSRNCSPVARADAASTRPTEAVSIDPLANDTDADGDPLVFQILNATGGIAIIDDGTTPTDAADDRINFTPGVPAPEKAIIEYQAVDPEGAMGESIVSVYINADGLLPAGVQSDPVTDQRNVGDSSEDCGGVSGPTSTTDPNAIVTPTSPPSTAAVTATTGKSSSTKKKSSGGTTTRRTTTTKPTTATTSAPGTTQPPATTTTKPPTTTTTVKPTPPPTTPAECGPFPASGTEAEQDAWADCVREHQGG